MGRDPALAGDAGKGLLVEEASERVLEDQVGTDGEGKALRGFPDSVLHDTESECLSFLP